MRCYNNLPGVGREPRETLGRVSFTRINTRAGQPLSHIHRLQTERCRRIPLHRSVLRAASDPAPVMLPWWFYLGLVAVVARSLASIFTGQ